MRYATYARQRDNYSCGPATIINLMKYYGVPVSYRDEIDYYRSICNTTEWGTNPKNLERVLKVVCKEILKVKYKVIDFPNLNTIKKELRQHHPLLIRNAWWDPKTNYEASHYSLLVDIDDEFIYSVNAFKGYSLARSYHSRLRRTRYFDINKAYVFYCPMV